ncbi:MAG: hypothetical protein GF400_03560 [Candidatus Eisenbacteria bacterium]|nr:hypothetical protein [Candidatus Eisenbacteria bacterium]
MIAFKIILSLLYLYAGLALLLGRKKFREEGKPPNILIPAALLLLAAVTTPFLR